MFEILYNFCGWNKKLFVIINSYSNIGILPYCLRMLTELFDIINFACGCAALIVYFYIKLQRISSPFEHQKQFWSVYNRLTRICVIYVVFGLVYSLLKFLVNLPRPFCSLPNDNFMTIADVTTARCLSSFPSAHTGLALLTVYCTWSYLNLFQKIAASGILLLVGLSRITLAMHYPADVIYSSPIAVLVIIIGNAAYQYKYHVIQRIGTDIYKQILLYKK